jgi:hypothetical protein
VMCVIVVLTEDHEHMVTSIEMDPVTAYQTFPGGSDVELH